MARETVWSIWADEMAGDTAAHATPCKDTITVKKRIVAAKDSPREVLTGDMGRSE
jgi:hypothetical protein